MKLNRIAKSYLSQAKPRVEDAEKALREGNFPYALRLSQEAVELSLKAVLKAVGIEYPKKHDVSDVLTQVTGRFPSWFQQKIPAFAEASRKLVKKREPSLYGDEESFLGPEALISEEEAQEAVSWSKQIHENCEKLLKELSTIKT